jgi:2-keto-4-pentenoate hydratase/2-oxohepta-3-ene-1,7-dioic acid hydratase in catechol pathway
MKFVRFTKQAEGRPRSGVVRGDSVLEIETSELDIDTDASGLGAVLEAYCVSQERVQTAVGSGPMHDVKDVHIGPPVSAGARVFALGGSYTSHLRAQGSALGKVPSLWVMPDTSIVGPGKPIVLTERVREDVRPAVELGLVIGRGGRDIPETAAYDHIAGYTIINDVTARTEWPGPMAYKLMDTFCPCGPHVVPADAVQEPHDLSLEMRQDGEIVFEGRTSGLRFTLSFIVSYLSTIVELRPGDVISTGDPGGVEATLLPGGRIEAEIAGVGILSNPIEIG